MGRKKIGIFDSGFGGLAILSNILKLMPEYDYVYLGDTARAPYGSRSDDQIYQFTTEAIEFLFSKNCDLVILACNTASAQALRRIQQNYLPKKHKGKNVLGVVVPTLEVIASDKDSKNILVIATEATVRSGAYPREILNIKKDISVSQKACPLFVPMIEAGEQILPFAKGIIKEYLKDVKKKKIDHLVLGCTHYVLIEKMIKQEVGSKVIVTNQARIIPKKLQEYLSSHPEFEKGLVKNGAVEIYTTDLTDRFQDLAEKTAPAAKIKKATL